ncbi:MAG TPA: hypothetical protein VF290_07930 [Pyrinomonadaceae bacterium]
MSQIEANKIKFKTVDGDPDKEDLKKCYFYPTATTGVYDLYAKVNGVDTLLASGISSGGSFSFTLDTFSWNIPDPNNSTNPLVISGSGSTATASGSWHNNDNPPPPTGSVGDDGNGESGTFQAQAGTTIDPEEEAASAANA